MAWRLIIVGIWGSKKIEPQLFCNLNVPHEMCLREDSLLNYRLWLRWHEEIGSSGSSEIIGLMDHYFGAWKDGQKQQGPGTCYDIKNNHANTTPTTRTTVYS